VIDIRGWVRTSLIDFPGHIATVLFTGGCDFRCPMCHNADLVLRPGSLPAIHADEVLAFLKRRVGKVTGLVLTGGEPLMQPGVVPFVSAVKACGVHVKLDTNGYHPDGLSHLIEQHLVDYVAMDVKAPLEKYPLLAGRELLDRDRILASVSLLAQGRVAWEFRTTVVPGMLDGHDIETIAKWLAGVGNPESTPYVLQQFRGIHTLSPELEGVAPYPAAEVRAMAARARLWLANVALRGV
jgi:pyruvate formate lyase activating enzyme